MDRRTPHLIDLLAHPGATFLEELVNGPRTEAELIAQASELFPFDQSTASRRLTDMERAGVIRRSPGNKRAPGKRWHVLAPEETTALLIAGTKLSDALAKKEASARRATRRRLRGRGT